MQSKQKFYQNGEIITQELPNIARFTHFIYALQAISIFFGPTFILAVIAVILNYVKYPDVAGTWLESHFNWQIRTFWWGLLGYVIGGLTAIILIGWVIMVVTYVWLLYRVIKGWLYLYDRKVIA